VRGSPKDGMANSSKPTLQEVILTYSKCRLNFKRARSLAGTCCVLGPIAILLKKMVNSNAYKKHLDKWAGREL